MPRSSMRVLGLDPALRVTGYGVIAGDGRAAALIEAGIVAPRTDRALEQRLADLYGAIVELIDVTKPDVVVIEELYTTYKNPMTAILMGHARGVMCLASAQAGLEVKTLGHSHVKRALVGSGGARKDQVNAMVTHLLGLRAAPKPNDVSDALAIALAYLNMSGRVFTH
ncbi:MAG: crossover junction endodeoxyribonuclease RuvC [Candidatus Eremiobacteraeota bacterium]|nr:crossover junction endodeoxyribonuclease RuvC [Candidatus Eremiobacteraeota bacterium]